MLVGDCTKQGKRLRIQIQELTQKRKPTEKIVGQGRKREEEGNKILAPSLSPWTLLLTEKRRCSFQGRSIQGSKWAFLRPIYLPSIALALSLSHSSLAVSGTQRTDPIVDLIDKHGSQHRWDRRSKDAQQSSEDHRSGEGLNQSSIWSTGRSQHRPDRRSKDARQSSEDHRSGRMESIDQPGKDHDQGDHDQMGIP